MKKIHLFIVILITFSLSALFVACDDPDIYSTTISVENEQITPSGTFAIVQCDFDTDATLLNVYVQYATTKDFSKYVELEMIQENGMYIAILEDLQLTTTYYVRYVMSNTYSSAKIEDIRSFQTLSQDSIVVTCPEIINYNSYYKNMDITFIGYVVEDERISVTERGVVYSRNQNPTILDNKLVSGSGAGMFTCNLTLTTYYRYNLGTYFFRAYVIHQNGISYGEQKTFTTP